jgi:DNA-binding NarL/FixJ family response regulator
VTGAYSTTPGLPLTPRMRDVLWSAACGASVRETALELGIADSTVLTIRTSACQRLGARTVAAAIALAFQRGAF